MPEARRPEGDPQGVIAEPTGVLEEELVTPVL